MAARRIKTEAKRNRSEDGKWLPGHSEPGPGRPPGVDFRHACEEAARAEGMTVTQVVQRLIRNLNTVSDACGKGSVEASREMLNRLCGPVKQEVEHSGCVNIQVVTGIGRGTEGA